jgi:HK97 family phage major capsid protein
MKTLRERYAAAREAAHDIVNSAKAEDRPLTDDERAKFDEIVAEANELKAKVERADADERALADLDEIAKDPTIEGKTIGEKLVNSPQYQAMIESYNGAQIPQGTRVQMGAVNVGSVKAALLEDPGFTAPSHRVAPATLDIIDLLQAITVIENSPPVIKTFTGVFTSAADDVAEGGTKPEASLVWTPTTLTLGTVAHHLPITNQALGHNPTLRARVDAHLVNGVRAKLQAKVATALAGAAGIQTQAFDTDLVTTLRRAVTKAQNGGAELGAGPTSILISANDAETLDLEQISNVVLSPGQTPAQATGIWRSPLVVSPSIPDGFAYVGDLKQVELHTGDGISVTTGWIDQQFIENSLTILAETEAVAGVFAAGALVKADLTA